MLDAAKQRMMEEKSKLTERRNCHAEMVSIMSTLYAKLLIVIGLAVPITASVTERVPASLNQVTDNSLERKKKKKDRSSLCREYDDYDDDDDDGTPPSVC